MAPITEDVCAVHNGTVIKLCFLKTGKSRIISPPCDRPGPPTSKKLFTSSRTETKNFHFSSPNSGLAVGVGVIAGNDGLSVLAWSDGGPTPNVHVYQYLLPSHIIDLRGTVCVVKQVAGPSCSLLRCLLPLKVTPFWSI